MRTTLFDNENLLIVLFLLVLIVDLEVSQLICLLVSSNHAKPIPQVVLLKVLLGQVLQISERKILTLNKLEKTMA